MSVLIDNPFEHILYEFEMYIETYEQIFVRPQRRNVFEKNLLVESHMIHLRILRNFFDEKYSKGMLARDMVNQHDELVFAKNDLKDVPRYMNNCCCRLGMERLKADYKEKTSEVMFNAFPVMMNRIYTFINLLNSDINEQYKEQWENEEIQIRANRILELYEVR